MYPRKVDSPLVLTCSITKPWDTSNPLGILYYAEFCPKKISCLVLISGLRKIKMNGFVFLCNLVFYVQVIFLPKLQPSQYNKILPIQ